MTHRIYLRSAAALLIAFSLGRFAGAVEFKDAGDISAGSVRGLTSMDVGDFNGDGRADVFAAEGGKHASGRRTLAWFESPANSSKSTWQRHDINVDADLAEFLGAAKLADIDSDGDIDVVISSDKHSGNKKSANVFVLLNPGSSSADDSVWGVQRVTPVAMPWHHINDMELADIDSNGRIDIVVRSLDPNEIHILFQAESGQYALRSLPTGIEKSEGLAVGDLNNDGRPDVTFTGYWLETPVDPQEGHFLLRAIDADFKAVNQNTKEAIGDIDGDGHPDVLIGPAERYRGGGNHHLVWYQNPGNETAETWKKTVVIKKINNCHTIKLVDVDRDSDLDIILGIPWGKSRVDLLLNDGRGNFSKPQTLVEGKGLYSGAIGDVDGDGDLDIVGQDTYSRNSRPFLYRNMLPSAGSD
ncbi:FG-GAP repeat domain-containing protein [Stratiformator vulcanicus]|uniref:FG-GAP repeat protein n=1 Tax=Stratiformator vulcanicus TaxID=2527980 RepID=A0A517R3C4_9PLAN|nr:VCBS repeat-containing protein [Stratiformator vulcanicus]QDT38347.1 FG-GAP repeat protein [Stratiformator vulcanicus]